MKKLGVKVYKAQPYVSANSNSRGWFEVEAGIRLSDCSDDTSQEEISTTEFQKLVDKARVTGKEYVLWNNEWVKIPENAEKFIEASKELKKVAPQGQVDLTKLPLILEIYTNIDDLEYNLTLLKEKEKMASEGIFDLALPSSFNGELYSYQSEGYAWMKRLQYSSLGGLLADDMGLGKTVQVIAFMSFLKEREQLKPSIVIAPTGLLENWYRELAQFCPEIRAYKHTGSARLKNIDYINESDIVLTSYETVTRDQLLLGQIDWRLIVCDEAQKIKNSSTMASSVVKALKGQGRIALTGTPVENSLGDLWSIIDYVQPGLLGSYKQFKENFELPLQKQNNLDEITSVEQSLISRMSPIYKRRTKAEELASILPKKEPFKFHVGMSGEQEQKYRQLVKEYKSGGKKNPLVILRKLQELCAHPAMLNEDFDSASLEKSIQQIPKLKKTIQLLDEASSLDEKVLIFTEYRKMQIILKRILQSKYGLYPVWIINGDISNRVELVNNFNRKPGFDVMVLSPKAAGVGLNIVGANHVVHYNRWWNPAIENQATDRVYRIGQKKDVKVYYPIVSHSEFQTVEVILDQLLGQKEQLAQRVIVPSSLINIKVEEFEKAFDL
ncbi:MAG: DEAD/DEAH box helicase [Clostridia bacterium]|nr:DEAD/DEAH box helicase [Clostridia bacterium]